MGWKLIWPIVIGLLSVVSMWDTSKVLENVGMTSGNVQGEIRLILCWNRETSTVGREAKT